MENGAEKPSLSRFGTHRVLEPRGVLPQAAWRLDATPRAYENEMLCDVDVLNIDSASFHQIASVSGDDPERVALHILDNVRMRGKQHNAVTGSGGMFVGRVREVGPAFDARGVTTGDHIASLVSLTLTPLFLERITRVDMDAGRLWVQGTAILFESGLFARLPDDIPIGVALAVLDVAGAPAQTRKLVLPGHTVVVLGADGKSGLLVCAQARACVGPRGRVIGVVPDRSTRGAQLARQEGYVDVLVEADARDAVRMENAMLVYAPQLADVVINCVNVPGTELGSILCARSGGTVYFFSMSTSFASAALGAEGIGKDVTMIIGNGFTEGHAKIALQTLRDHPALMQYFAERFDTAHEERFDTAHEES
ncbi:MAG TPA: L-erythro-3,5-diaminohexanoate dehydrogenase [Candidatus Acidoferrales bacterium]|nr:L-erythro-3,5-diaminohexanoate dehydrogenase [Candidatus Acidoferrales bacterium]